MSDPGSATPEAPAQAQPGNQPAGEPKAAQPGAQAQPANPGSPAPGTKPAEAPAQPSGEKSILDKAGEQAAPKTPSEFLDAAHAAVAAWQANPTDVALKATADKAVADAKKAAEDAKTANQPPTEYKFTAPEGVEKLDENALKAFTPLAKELGLTQEGAQKLVGLQATLQKQQADADAKAWNDYQATQIEETKKTLGAEYEKELAYVAKVRDTFFSKESMAFINQYGLGNNVHFIKALIGIGKKMSVERHVEGGPGPEAKGADARKMFPSMPNP